MFPHTLPSTPRVTAEGIGYDTVLTRERGMGLGTEKVTRFSEKRLSFCKPYSPLQAKTGAIRSQEW